MKTFKALRLLDCGKAHKSGAVVGIPTRIDVLDTTARGLPVGVVLLAGRPESGHEVLARQVALTVSQAGTPVIWFSTQLNAEALMGYFLAHSMAVQVPADNIDLTIVDTPSLTTRMISVKLDEWLQVGCSSRGLIIVDDLAALLKSSFRGAINQGEIVRELRGIALARNLSLILCCGLSRKLEERKNKMPRLSDLNAITPFVMEAEQVLATHYAHHYEPEISPKDDWQIMMLKNRNGPIGSMHLSKKTLPWPEF